MLSSSTSVSISQINLRLVRFSSPTKSSVGVTTSTCQFLAAPAGSFEAFNVFPYGRMIGAAAEIDHHLNRGRDMDTRIPLEQCAFVV